MKIKLRKGFGEFNKSIFKDKDISWFDRKGVIPLDNKRNAEIILKDKHIVGFYDCYIIQVIHKLNGLITSHEFYINEYLDISDRIDNRSDWDVGFEVWYNTQKGVEWYISIPSEQNIKKLTEAIFDFIALYR